MMRPSRKRSIFLALATAALAVGCGLNLDPPTLVKTPRILAIVADPPEAAPGQDVRLRVLAYDPMGRELHTTFHACLDASAFFGTSSNGNGMSSTMRLCNDYEGVDAEVTIPGEDMDVTAYLAFIPDAEVRRLVEGLLATAGLPIEVHVDVSVTDPSSGEEVVLVSGFKRIGLTTRPHPTTNPPYVYFAIEDSVYLGGVGTDPFECHPWLSEPIQVPASPAEGELDTLTLEPLDDPDEWTESFLIYDYAGTVRTGYEGAYYSWYATGGVMSVETTQGPAHDAEPTAYDAVIRNNEWSVPREPGTYDFWIVLRDGHLGTNACHTTIEVTARED